MYNKIKETGLWSVEEWEIAAYGSDGDGGYIEIMKELLKELKGLQADGHSVTVKPFRYSPFARGMYAIFIDGERIVSVMDDPWDYDE